jgi:hypothetical protein
MTIAITDHYQRRKTESPATLYNLGHAIDMPYPVSEI